MADTGGDLPDLLFFDTFSHDNSEDLNLDLVQFPRAVIVHEVRIVPLGTKVTADVPGGVRLGATNPSSFKLELYVNNLSNPNASTFEKLGLLHLYRKLNGDGGNLSGSLFWEVRPYHTTETLSHGDHLVVQAVLEYKENVDIQLRTETKIATDGLIIKGWYQTITLAVYGTLTTVTQGATSPPPPPPINLRSKPTSILPMGAENAEFLAMQVQHSIAAATQKAALERTQEWAERAAMSTHAMAATSNFVEILEKVKSQPAEPLHSPMNSPPINPRDIPLEHRGGTRDPRDPPREREPSRESRENQELGEGYEEKKLDSSENPDHAAGRLRRRDSRSRDTKDEYLSDEEKLKKESQKEEKVPDRDSREFWEKKKEHEGASKSKELERTKERVDKDKDVLDKPPNRKRGDDSVSKSSPLRSPSPGSKPSMRNSRTRSPESPGFPEEDTEPGEIPEANEGEKAERENAAEAMDLYGALSDGEIQEGDGDYSTISSDENNIQFEDELPQNMGELGDWDTTDDAAWNYGSIASFNPYQCDLAPLETFSDASLTPYELEKQRLVLSKVDIPEMPASAKQLLSMVESFRNAEHHERWVEAMEELPNLVVPGLAYLINKTDHKDVLELLIDWTFDGLDIQKAMLQPEPAYKIRHLKMGIRAAGCLCSCDSYIAFRMLSREVQHKLLDLYLSAHMVTPIKLQILSALDQTTRLKEGLDWLLGRHHLQIAAKSIKSKGDSQTQSNETTPMEVDNPTVNSSNTKVELMEVQSGKDGGLANGSKSSELFDPAVPPTAYQRLVEIMLSKQMVRPMAGLASLMRKAHFYEVLLKLMKSVNVLVENMPSIDVSKPAPTGASEEDEDNGAVEMEMNEPPILDAALEEEIYVIIQCIDEVTKILNNADNLIGQPPRTLPNSARFDLPKRPVSASPNLYHMFNACRLLECVFVLLSSLATCNHSVVFLSIKNLLQSLMKTQSGLLYLSFRVETINGILRTLTQNVDYAQEEERELNPANHLGLIMVYYLQTIQHIDQLNEFNSKASTEKEMDDASVLAVLHNLYSLTFTPQGRDALVYVFTLDDNVSVLLPYIEMTGDEEKNIRIRRSVCFVYAVSMLVVIIRYSDRVEWLEKYGHRLLAFTEAEAKLGKVDERIGELQDWLNPIKQIVSFMAEESVIQELVTQLRQYSDDVSDLPKGIITVVRILKYMSVSPEYKDEEQTELLKYKFVLSQLFTANCLSLFTNILQKVRDILLLPWQQGFPQGATERTLVLSLVQPVLSIMKSLLSYLILSCGKDFKDLSTIPSLLSIHTVLCSVTHTGLLANDIQQVQNDIVDTLMAFTQPPLSPEESEEALSSSLWSMMVKEVLKYTLTAPYTFLSGLILISEMLPLPLPIQTRENLSPQELTEVVNNRKRWSAHLHPHTTEIQNIIHNLAGTSCQPLHQLLRRVCWQLADLAVPTALTIIRSLLDTLLESLDFSKTAMAGVDAQVDPNSKHEVYSSSQTARILNLFGFLMNQAAMKAAFLSFSRSGLKTDEKYNDVLPRLVVLLNIVSEAPPHIQAQESIVSIFQSLCDVEITLVTPESCLTPFDQLSNGLPSKEQLSLICNSLLEHIDNRDQKFSSILPSLRTLTLLMDHDYGFYYVKQAMEKVPTAFFNLFMQINATFSKDSSDCIATLSSAAECIQFLVSLPNPLEGLPDEQSSGVLARTYTMSFKDVRDMLGWSATEDVLAHPLNDLDILLCEYAKDEETLKAVYESVNAVVGVLRSDEDQVNRPEITEPVLPPPEPLTTQFNLRAVYLLTDDEDERLSTTYWLSTPMGDESDHEQELVRCNFIEMSSTYCTGFDLEAELKKGTTTSETPLVPKRKRRMTATRRSQDMINTSKMRGSGGGFVAPMRGRGFGRGGGNNNTNRGDLFRSRPPNTSRPPSMHVDDFVKFETQNQQGAPVIPVTMNPPRRAEDAIRGHGFDRGGRGGNFQNRWRFFSPPGSYGQGGHREEGMGRGGYHGIGMPSPRGIVRGTATGPPILSRGSPSKPNPWGGRNTRNLYGLQGFGRGESPIQEPIERIERRRENVGGGNYFMHGNGGGGVPWADHKEREPDQRFMGPPLEPFPFWRDRERHQRTSTR